MQKVRDDLYRLIKNEVHAGYINEKQHPQTGLFLYNYTPETQYENRWNEATLMCRGLILDKEGHIVALPFPKIFNLDEFLARGNKIPNEEFEIYEKLDGSLIILFHYDGQWHTSTRGSFNSEQSIKASEILNDRYSDLKKNILGSNLTYLLEIIYPQNRIVVNYGSREDLTLLAVYDRDKLKEIPIEIFKHEAHFKQVNIYDSFKNFDEIQDYLSYQSGLFFEGFVIRFKKSGLRLKIKAEDYKRLHKIIAHLSEKSIWESLKDKKSLSEVLIVAPDEFHSWIKETSEKITQSYDSLESRGIELYNRALSLSSSQKDFALEVQKEKEKVVQTIAFSLKNNRNYSETIWKHIEPMGSVKPERKASLEQV